MASIGLSAFTTGTLYRWWHNKDAEGKYVNDVAEWIARGIAGEAPGVYVNICDFVTINTGGAAQDFGDIGWAMGDMGMCSATNGGLGGF